jgi:hypothetical protein
VVDGRATTGVVAMTWIDDVLQVFKETPVAFTIGVLVGFALSNRYRVIRRDPKEEDK